MVTKEKTIIDNNFDSKKKSIFVIKGNVTLSERINPLYCSSVSRDFDFGSEKTNKYQVIAEVEARTGIGKIFLDNVYSKCLLESENAVFL